MTLGSSPFLPRMRRRPTLLAACGLALVLLAVGSLPFVLMSWWFLAAAPGPILSILGSLVPVLFVLGAGTALLISAARLRQRGVRNGGVLGPSVCGIAAGALGGIACVGKSWHLVGIPALALAGHARV